jgi:hypothetical protein
MEGSGDENLYLQHSDFGFNCLLTRILFRFVFRNQSDRYPITLRNPFDDASNATASHLAAISPLCLFFWFVLAILTEPISESDKRVPMTGVPMLVRLESLQEAFSYVISRYPLVVVCPLYNHVTKTGRASNHDALDVQHPSQPPVTFGQVLIGKADDRTLFMRQMPTEFWRFVVVPIFAAAAFQPCQQSRF